MLLLQGDISPNLFPNMTHLSLTACSIDATVLASSLQALTGLQHLTFSNSIGPQGAAVLARAL